MVFISKTVFGKEKGEQKEMPKEGVEPSRPSKATGF